MLRVWDGGVPRSMRDPTLDPDMQGVPVVTPPGDTKGRKGVAGLAVPAGLLIGLGVGFMIDNVAAGLFIGLGSGFLVMIPLRVILGVW